MYRKIQLLIFTFMATTLALTATSTQAGLYRLLVESNDDLGAGAEVFQASFSDFDGVVNSTSSDVGFTALNIGPQFSIGGLAYDGAYRLLVESNDDRNAGSEVFAASFDTYDDLIAGTSSGGGFTQLNIGPNFNVGGFAYDGSFRILVESNDDRDAGTEVFAASFGTFDDLLSSTFADSSFTQLNIGPLFNLAGFAFDGLYRLLVESINDRNAGAEVFLASFADFNGVLNSTFADTSFTQLNIGPNFGARGFAYEPNLIAVSEPGGLNLMALAFIGLLALGRSKTNTVVGGIFTCWFTSKFDPFSFRLRTER